MIGSGLRNGFLYIALRILQNKKRFKDEENYFVWNEVVELVLELLLNTRYCRNNNNNILRSLTTNGSNNNRLVIAS